MFAFFLLMSLCITFSVGSNNRAWAQDAAAERLTNVNEENSDEGNALGDPSFEVEGDSTDDVFPSTSGFSAASIMGSYASTNIGRGGQAPVSDVGVFNFDGQGNFWGVVDVNLPGESFNQRQIFRSEFTGSYVVNADGTGTTRTSFTLPDGSTRETGSIFVITDFNIRSGQKIAKEFTLISNDLSSTSGNLDVATLHQIPSGGFENASLKGTYGFYTVGHGGESPTADAGLTTFDGEGSSVIYFNQNIPGEFFGQREIFSGSVTVSYDVNPDGTGTSDVASFVITDAKRIDGELIATEVFFIANGLDPFTGNLQTTLAKRLSANTNPNASGFAEESLKGAYAGKVIGRGGQTPQVTAALLNFDGKGSFAGSGVINLPGSTFGERVFVEAPFIGAYTIDENGVGRTFNGGESLFVVTKTQVVRGTRLATEFALVVKDLQATGNLITAIFSRLPEAGQFETASLRGTYAVSSLGKGGISPEAGIGTITFDGVGHLSSRFTQNIPGPTVFERQLFEGGVEGTYTIDQEGIGRTITSGGESVFVVTKARVTKDQVKLAEEFFLVAKDLSPLSRSVITAVGKRLSR